MGGKWGLADSSPSGARYLREDPLREGTVLLASLMEEGGEEVLELEVVQLQHVDDVRVHEPALRGSTKLAQLPEAAEIDLATLHTDDARVEAEGSVVDKVGLGVDAEIDLEVLSESARTTTTLESATTPSEYLDVRRKTRMCSTMGKQ